MKQFPEEKFSEATTYKIIIQLVHRIKILHELGFIHNDIKPANILVGLNDPSVIYLIDFGVSFKYHKKDGVHIDNEI